jgi:phosphoenolpyruvate carboxylase
MLAPTLERTNSALNQSNTQLAAMYKELTATRAALESIPPRLDESNRSLKESAASLHHLEPMMASLRNLDESLAVLRKTIENINKSIPLLDITKGTPPADEALQRARDTEPKAPAATPP